MALMSIFYCVCDNKFSFHPLTFSNWLFYFQKEFSFLSGKLVRVSPSICPGFYFLWCQTLLVFSPRCPSTCSCWRISKFCLYLSSGPALLRSPIEAHFYLVQGSMEKENVIINKDICFLEFRIHEFARKHNWNN